MVSEVKTVGRILPAPENFVDSELAYEITTQGLDESRRGFLLKSFAAASAVLASGATAAETIGKKVLGGDPNILTLPEHSTTLGKPVVTNPYGMPSKFEANLQRR